MKKHIRLLNVAAVLLVLSAPVMTLGANGDQDVRKQRMINKNYSVTADDKLEIDNQFGNVVVSTWDKSEITVDIEISARASSEDRAQEIMNRIDVKDGREGHNIWFKTKVGEIHNNNSNKGRNDGERGFYIDYVVHMPAGNRLEIANSFGKTEIPAFKGLVTLTSKFGSLSTGKLDNVDQIDVEFGKAYITSVNSGKVIFKFNKESRIGKVDGNVKITSEFSQNVQFSVADGIQELSVFESYSGVRVVVEKDLSAQIDVHTSFGKFHNESEFEISELKDPDIYGPKFDRDYTGKAGDGRARIRIKSSFGSVRLSNVGDKGQEDEGDDDDDDGGKGKHKNKNKSKDKDATDNEAI